MKLLDLIEYLVAPDKLVRLYQEQGITISENEDLSIYMENTLALDSDIKIFSSSETEDRIEFQKDGVNYTELLAVDTAVDILETGFDFKSSNVTNLDKAKRLLEYGIYNA